MQTLIRGSFYSVLQKRLIINSESELEYVDPRIQLPFLCTLHTYTVYLHILPNILPVENFRKACMKCRLRKIKPWRIRPWNKTGFYYVETTHLKPVGSRSDAPKNSPLYIML